MKPPQLGGPNYGFWAVVAFALAGLAIAAQVFLFAETDTPDPCTLPNNENENFKSKFTLFKLPPLKLLLYFLKLFKLTNEL